jgi:hypothetical protein
MNYFFRDKNSMYGTITRFDINHSNKDKALIIFMRNSLPYCIQTYKDEKGENKTLFLNREYKPLGVFGYTPTVSYAPYLEFRGFYGIDEILIYDDTFKKRKPVTYFYNDGCSPFSGDRRDIVNYIFYLKVFILTARIKQGLLSVEEAMEEGESFTYKLLKNWGYKENGYVGRIFYKQLEKLEKIKD